MNKKSINSGNKLILQQHYKEADKICKSASLLFKIEFILL